MRRKLSDPRRRKQRTNASDESAYAAAAAEAAVYRGPAVAKDTEKLIRQLSLIAYLMAERRPVTATEIRRDVEGYSEMTEDAFARRFYADRAELDSLGIHLTVDKPADGFSEQENYSLAPEAFFLPADRLLRRGARRAATALRLLDGEFAYAEPLRLALQQLTWGRPSPSALPPSAQSPSASPARPAAPSSPRGWRRSRPRSTAASGSSSSTTRSAGETAPRRSTRTSCSSRAASTTWSATSHERDAIRVFRLSRIRGKVAYATKAEHDFERPDDFDPRDYANRIPWQLGDPRHGRDLDLRRDRLARGAQLRPLRDARRRRGMRPVFRTDYAIAAPVLAWALGDEEHARARGPPEPAEELGRRLECVAELHRAEPFASRRRRPPAARPGRASRELPPAPARGRREPPPVLRAACHACHRPDRSGPRRRRARGS